MSHETPATTTAPEGGTIALRSRVFHWLTVALVVPMLFIGASMVASLDHYAALLAVHRPLGIAVLIVTVARIVNRKLTPLPPFLSTMSARERVLASWSERLLYTLLVAMPLVGWGMLSAGHYPIVLFGSIHLPPIVPAHPVLHAALRRTHTVLAYLLFVTFLAHLTSVLVHALVKRDGLLRRMVGSR